FNAPAYIALCSTLPRLANGYATAMRFWNQHVALLKPRVFEWRYEDAVREFETQVERLGEFLQLGDTAPLRQFSEHAMRRSCSPCTQARSDAGSAIAPTSSRSCQC